MPPPLDLTGCRFGKLVVLGPTPGPRAAHGGRWRCRCDCGRIEDIRAYRLPHDGIINHQHEPVTSCRTCRMTRECVVCKRTFVAKNSSEATCSDECRRERMRANHRRHYYRLVASNPDHNVQKHAALLERAKVDPIVAQRLRTYELKHQRERKNRLRSDPDYRERINANARARYDPAAKKEQIMSRLAAMSPEQREAYLEDRRAVARAWYRKNSADILARRRAWLDSLSPESHARWMERRRTQQRLYKRKYRAELLANPELHEKFLADQREYERQLRRRRRLNELLSVGSKLITKKDQGHE